MNRSLALLVLSVVGLVAACGGEVTSEEAAAPAGGPPPVNTRYVHRVDGTPVNLDAPYGTHFITESVSYVTFGAQQARGGDFIQSSSILIADPLEVGSFDCTPNERGETHDGAPSVSAQAFLGYKATIKDCVLTLTYVAPDRVVGTFSATAHAPEESSLKGTTAKIDGEFDVPLVEKRL